VLDRLLGVPGSDRSPLSKPVDDVWNTRRVGPIEPITTVAEAYACTCSASRERSELSPATAAALTHVSGASAMLRDREHGGSLLARELGHIRGQGPIVLGIVRGGVPVALEVAKALDAPLDFITVQKVGAVECPEYTIAAAAEGGAVYVRRDALHEVGMTDDDAAELAKGAAIELVQRVRVYRGDARPPKLAGRTVVLNSLH
jgi:hypothetical protein